ncbi:MAG: enoyl-CoA hydratase-related protein [Pseudomonadota bacterium]
MSNPDHLLADHPASGVARLTLNRPDRRNALSTPLLHDLAVAMERADADHAIRCIVVTGGETVFAAGADINEIADKDPGGGLADLRPGSWQRIRDIRTPVVAAVEGYCLGAGNELAMCCDIIVAGRDAKFGQPETNLGIIPGAGGGATLTRLVGRARAMHMVLTGSFLSAEEALDCGLIAELAETGKANARGVDLATVIASRAPLAMQQAKAVVRAAYETTHTAHLSFERQAFSLLLGTADKREGIEAFLEKRKPNWRGADTE